MTQFLFWFYWLASETDVASPSLPLANLHQRVLIVSAP